MNEENTRKILEKFPEFFTNIDNIKVSLMAFGFECGDGWFDLIYNLCADIKEWYMENEGRVPERFYLIQVKEKFGGLRFYTSGAPREVRSLIEKAEAESMRTCEVCGKHVKDSDSKRFYRDKLPWIRTLCDECLEEHLEERNLKYQDYISEWQKKRDAEE